jgi:hypothetical protein
MCEMRFSSRLFRHSPMNKMHPKGTCGRGHLGFIMLAKIQKGGHDGLDDTRFG